MARWADKKGQRRAPTFTEFSSELMAEIARDHAFTSVIIIISCCLFAIGFLICAAVLGVWLFKDAAPMLGVNPFLILSPYLMIPALIWIILFRISWRREVARIVIDEVDR